MARLKIPRKNNINSVFGKYMPMNEPQTLNEVLSQFEGEVDNAITRQRIEFALENWYMRTGEYVRFDDLNLN